MKVRLLVEIEVEVKDKFHKMESVKSSDRGSQWVDRITTPTQADVEKEITLQLTHAHPSASVDRFSPIESINEVAIKETTIVQ